MTRNLLNNNIMKNVFNSLIISLFRIYNVFVSLLLFVVVFLISHSKTIGYFAKKWWGQSDNVFLSSVTRFFEDLNPLWSYGIYVLFVVFLTWTIIRIFPVLDDDEMQNADSILSFEDASPLFTPNYLAYFFVALSANDKYAVLGVFLIMLVISYKSSTMLFNPLLVLFNYHFYLVINKNKKRSLVITKKLLNPSATSPVSFPSLKRLNDNTFIDISKEK